jgi:antitoxin (DNA-binding transcriptional repressor) of toxin-antitoxin stability system
MPYVSVLFLEMCFELSWGIKPVFLAFILTRGNTMTQISVQEAAPILQELIHEVARGNDVLISNPDGLEVKLVLHKPERRRLGRRTPGLGGGETFVVEKDFDDELPDAFWLGQDQ